MACDLAGVLLRMIIITVVVMFSYVNTVLFPYLLPYLLKLLDFPCNHSLVCFPSKISSCPSLLQCSHPFSIFLPFPMKSLTSFLFHNQPFCFPTFLSHFFLLMSAVLICWILLFLASPIILFPVLSFLSLLLVCFPHVQAFNVASLPSSSWCRWRAEEVWQLPRMWLWTRRSCKW